MLFIVIKNKQRNPSKLYSALKAHHRIPIIYNTYYILAFKSNTFSVF